MSDISQAFAPSSLRLQSFQHSETRRWAFYNVGAYMCGFDTGRQHYPAAYVVDASDWLADAYEGEFGSSYQARRAWFDEKPGAFLLAAVRNRYDGGLAAFADAVHV